MRTALIAATLVLLGHPVAAADLRAETRAGGGFGNVGVIRIDGALERGDAARFRALADDLAKRPLGAFVEGTKAIAVRLDSEGGSVAAALEIGRLVRERFMATEVPKGAACASACVYILAAGVERTVADDAEIGLHRPYFEAEDFAGLTALQARDKYGRLTDAVRAYWSDMGGLPDAFQVMLATPSERMRWLDQGTVRGLGIAGLDPAWDELRTAKMIVAHGAQRWAYIRGCIDQHGGPQRAQRLCELDAAERFPR